MKNLSFNFSQSLFSIALVLLIVLSGSESVEAKKSKHPKPDNAIDYGTDDPSRQWLLLYLADQELLKKTKKASSLPPRPVYIWAHANSLKPAMHRNIVKNLNQANITAISWESYNRVLNRDHIETAWIDLEVVLKWVVKNAEKYNLDPHNIILGGGSRGSGLSWKAGHGHFSPSNSDLAKKITIRGIYMIAGLPTAFWDGGSGWWDIKNDVTVDSPPVFFSYKQYPSQNDHNPDNGYKIIDKYYELGIGDRISLAHSLTYSDDIETSQFLVRFSKSVFENPSQSEEDFRAPETFDSRFQKSLRNKGYEVVQGNWSEQPGDDNAGLLTNEKATGINSVLMGSSVWEDFTITTRLKTLNSGPTDKISQAPRVIFGVKYVNGVLSKYHEAYINLEGYVVLNSVANGVTTRIATSSSNKFDPKAWSFLSITEKGKSITIRLNAKNEKGAKARPVITETLKEYTPGRVGFLTKDCSGAFQSVSIYEN